MAGLALVGAAVRRGRPTPAVQIVSEPVINDTGRPELDRLARTLGMLVNAQLASLPHVTLIEGKGPRSQGLVFRSKLIIWDGSPTLSLEALRPLTETVVWAGMAYGPAPRLAGNTVAQIGRFAAASTQGGR